jgi:acyl-CoA thioesterase FadM
MTRTKIELPDHLPFRTEIPIRITDLNYGGHVGNDALLSLIHEARVKYLNANGYKEMDFGGVGLIMSDVSIQFKLEIFYGDTVEVSVGAGDFTRAALDIYYNLKKKTDKGFLQVALAKTGMICYNYDLKKIVSIPDGIKERLTDISQI